MSSRRKVIYFLFVLSAYLTVSTLEYNDQVAISELKSQLLTSK